MSEPDVFEIQQQVARRLDSFAANYGKTPKERFSLGYLITREDGLKAMDFVANDDLLNVQANDEQRASHVYFSENVFDKYEAMYFDISGRICQKRLELTPAAPPPPLVGECQPDPAHLPQPAVAIAVQPPARPPPNPAVGLHPNPLPVYPDQQQPAARPNFMPPALAHHLQIPRLNVPSFSGAIISRSFRSCCARQSNPTAST